MWSLPGELASILEAVDVGSSCRSLEFIDKYLNLYLSLSYLGQMNRRESMRDRNITIWPEGPLTSSWFYDDISCLTFPQFLEGPCAYWGAVMLLCWRSIPPGWKSCTSDCQQIFSTFTDYEWNLTNCEKMKHVILHPAYIGSFCTRGCLSLSMAG